ncbi:MAG: ATP-dependent helicase RhlE [Verrucomicrobiota bacterium]
MRERPSDSFHPLLRHHLVNTLGWPELRPLQELAAGPILAGEHALVIAPTAGGKTEAAVLPAISRLLTENWDGTSILYLCPLKALLNNLHGRLESYFGMVGYEVGLWHGDVSPADRKKIEANKPACLLTTPESLEVMLISSRRELRELLVNVRMVVIDEIHAFAGDDRGLHLLAVVERIQRLAGREFQRIGLSATVGNPDTLIDWLAGHCAGVRRVVTVAAANVEADVCVDYVSSLENAAYLISQLHEGEKRLVFCDSRRRVEELAVMLRERGISTFVSHSSLSAGQRREAEAAFSSDSNCVIVATSTLELGIDVGDLDRVIQIDAPGTVASFLQRIGRTGRRPGSSRNCLFLATSDNALLHATALISLWEKGYVEPIVAPRDPYHLFVQQLLALTLQTGGIRADGWRDWLGNFPAFSNLPAEEMAILIQHLIDSEILFSDGVLLSIGREGEKRFGRKHFLELVSVFTSPPLFDVVHGRDSIGMVDWLTVAVEEGKERRPLILSGRAWDIQSIDFSGRKVFVIPSAAKGRARWYGQGQGLSFEMARGVREVLLSDEASARWSKRCQAKMESLREEYRARGAESTACVSDQTENHVIWWNFAGRFLNEAFASVLETSAGIDARFDDFSLKVPYETDVSVLSSTIRRMLADPRAQQNLPISKRWLDGLKFSDCLPERFASRAARGRISVAEGTIEAIHISSNK